MNNSVLVNEIEYWRLLLQSNSNSELIKTNDGFYLIRTSG